MVFLSFGRNFLDRLLLTAPVRDMMRTGGKKEERKRKKGKKQKLGEFEEFRRGKLIFLFKINIEEKFIEKIIQFLFVFLWTKRFFSSTPNPPCSLSLPPSLFLPFSLWSVV
jgi:hypothetical protein